MPDPKPISLTQIEEGEYLEEEEPQPFVVVGQMPGPTPSVSTVNGESGDVVLDIASPQDVEDAIAGTSGWASYADTQYTSANRFVVPADTDTLVPNNAGFTLDEQLPLGVTQFYNPATGKVEGPKGNSGLFSVSFMAQPQTNSATEIQMWWDIGGSIGPVFPDVKYFPKQQASARPIVYNGGVYLWDTWAANGAAFTVRSDGPLEIWGGYLQHSAYSQGPPYGIMG